MRSIGRKPRKALRSEVTRVLTLLRSLPQEGVTAPAFGAWNMGWPMDPAHAVMVIQGFILPVIAQLDPRAMVDQKAAAGVRATYDIRLRGGGRAFFVFDDGAVRIEEPSGRRVDCHILAEPAAFLNVIWARQSQWKAIAKGQLLAWGRKPWLGPRLRVMMRNA